jgi:hypothetical protein
MTDLIAELAEVVRLADRATQGKWLANYAVKGNLGGKPEVAEFYVYSPEAVDDVAIASDIIDPDTDKPSPENAELIAASVNFLRTHHATLTRILTDDAAIRAAHHDLVIRLGEVTTRLEAAERGAKLFRLAEENAGKSISARGVRFELHFDARSDSSTMRDYLSVMRDSAREDSNE